MGYNIYNADGSLFASNFSAGGGAGSGSSATYDRMDVGILLLNQQWTDMGIYDFRVPGDANQNTFKYRLPRDGFLLGVSMTGTLSTQIVGGHFVQRFSVTGGAADDIMKPADVGNQQTYVPATFQQKGVIVSTPAPVPLKKDDLISMKFWSDRPVTASLAGFLIIGLAPQ